MTGQARSSLTVELRKKAFKLRDERENLVSQYHKEKRVIESSIIAAQAKGELLVVNRLNNWLTTLYQKKFKDRVESKEEEIKYIFELMMGL